ncbi:MAG: hypothetical protein HYR67_12335, partial [Bacteroidetes bacterium]|nr:hypothetical protein [Bacteroidota bacterium]
FSDAVAAGSCQGEQIITRTWTLTDDCGNSTTHTQIITVKDNTAPTFTAPAAITIYKDASCNYDASVGITGDVTDEADNCDNTLNATFSDAVAAGSCVGEQIITRTWTLTDDCGNSTTHTQIITVKDNTPPSITYVPSAVTVKCSSDVPGFNDGAVVASDNCSGTVAISHLADAITAGSCANRYTIVRTYVATDICGNSSTATQSITVNDDVAPVISGTPAAITYSCSSAVPVASIATVGASDNCSGTVTVTVNDVISNQTCANKYTITRIWTATDICGNTSTSSRVITVNDNVAPVISGTPAAITYSCSSAVPVASIATVSASDNCSGTVAVTVNDVISNQTCANKYTITRIWTATDICGNTSTSSQVITVNDNAAPTAATQNVTVALNSAGIASITPAQVNMGSSDNCTTTANLSFSLSQSSFNCTAVGTPKTVVLTVTDECGNSSTKSAIITVQPYAIPAASATVTVTSASNQYSDNATFTATLTNGVLAGGCQAATTVSFYIGTQLMGTVPLTVSGSNLTGTLTTPLLETSGSSELNPCAGIKNVKAVFGGTLSNAFTTLPQPTTTYTIAKEDAVVTYTGVYFAAAATSTATTASVALSATVQDFNDFAGQRGDISKARIKFINKTVPSSPVDISPWLTPVLVDPSDLTTATVNFNWNAPLGANTVGIVVDCNGTYGYYVKTNLNDIIITAINPCDASVTGGGYLRLIKSDGLYAGDSATKSNFGFNVKYQKNKGYQGEFTEIIRMPRNIPLNPDHESNGEDDDSYRKVYQIKAS